MNEVVAALECADNGVLERAWRDVLATVNAGRNGVEELRVLGILALTSGDAKQAERWFLQALEATPQAAELWQDLALALAELQDQAGAVAAMRQAVRFAPGVAEYQNRLGAYLLESGNLQSAEACFRESLRLDESSADALNNLGQVMYADGKIEEGIDFFQRALNVAPGYLMPMVNLAACLKAAGRLKDAIEWYRKTAALYPECETVQVNLAMALLADGQWAEGWTKWERRLQAAPFFASRQVCIAPLWNGEPGQGGVLLLRAEQGFGDTLQFCRYARLAAARGWRIVLEVQPELVELLKSVAGAETVIGFDEPLPAANAWCSLLSLPQRFATQPQTVPAATAYLQAKEAAIARWRLRIERICSSGLKVGVVWQGKRRDAQWETSAADRRRALTREQVERLLSIKEITFFSLQKDAGLQSEKLPMLDWMNECADFADTAALVMNLDLVISVDTAVAHLAAALGKEVWLLDSLDGCWRWLRKRSDTPWYPTMRLFRQKKRGDWDAEVDRIRRDLKARSQQHRLGSIEQ